MLKDAFSRLQPGAGGHAKSDYELQWLRCTLRTHAVSVLTLGAGLTHSRCTVDPPFGLVTRNRLSGAACGCSGVEPDTLVIFLDAYDILCWPCDRDIVLSSTRSAMISCWAQRTIASPTQS